MTDVQELPTPSLSRGGRRERQADGFLTDAIHLLFLCGLAFAQPLYDLLGRNAEFFVARRSEPVDVLLLAAGLSFLIPGILLLLEGMAGLLGRRIRQGAHCLLVGVLVSITLLPASKPLVHVPGWALLSAAAIFGAAAAVSYWRFQPLRSSFATFLIASGTLVFPIYFLLLTPVAKLVLPAQLEIGATRLVAGKQVDTPIVMVVVDELSVSSLMSQDREIDAIRYPSFAALAREATWYRNATTVADMTAYAIPAMLTGRYPDRERLPNAADYPENLFTLLAETHQLNVFESMTHLCPDELCVDESSNPGLSERLSSLFRDVSFALGHLLVPADLATSLPTITATWGDFKPPEPGESRSGSHSVRGPLAKLEIFMRSLRQSPSPTLHYLHILLPHGPWEYLPTGQKYGPLDANYAPHGLQDGAWSAESWPAIQGFQRHLLQVGLVDKILGEILGKLRSIGLYDRALLIVTADHGVSFRPGDHWRRLTATNYQDILPVPLFIKVPHQDLGEIDDRNVESIDILPTILGYLNVEGSLSMDGQSVLSRDFRERSEKVAFQRRALELQSFRPRVEEKYETLARIGDLFGSGEDSLFAIGPYPDLLGRRTNEIASTSAARFEVELDGSRLLDEVDPDGSFVPTHVTGRLFESVPEDSLHLAISVNGMIAAVTQTYRDNKSTRFTSMVPREALAPGRNEVELFVVHAMGDLSPQLARIRSRSRKAVTYRIAQSSDGRELIETSSGTAISIDNASLTGSIQSAIIKDSELQIRGWAADLKNLQIPERILIFVNGESFFSGKTNRDRWDAVKRHGRAVKRSGFRFRFPLQMLEDLESSEIRIFALASNGVATELRYPVGYSWQATYALVTRDQDEMLVKSDGSEISVVPQAVLGTVSSGKIEKDQLILTGWATDAESGEAPDAIVVFADGELLHAARPHLARPDLVKGEEGRPVPVAGYEIAIPVRMLQDVEIDEIRVFAVLRRNVASEVQPTDRENANPGVMK